MGPTGDCYKDMVLGPGSPKFDDAYFDINYIRAYTTGIPTPSATPSASRVSGVVVVTSTILDPNPSVSTSTRPDKSLSNGQDRMAFSCAIAALGMVLFGATLIY